MAAMKTLRDINILQDQALQQTMVRWSFIVFVVTVATSVSAYVAEALAPGALLRSLVVVALASVVALPVHELVHAAAFKLYGGHNIKVSFGAKDAFLYTKTNDAVLPRNQFVKVLLAPSVVLTVVLLLGGLIAQDGAGGLLAAGLHLSGCTGDWLMASLILVTPGVTHVQDTETGCRLLSD